MLHKLNSPKLRAKILSPFVTNIDPNFVTILAFLSAVFSGMFFYYNMIIFGAIFVLMNGFFDVLDGEIAKTYKRVTRFGDFLDHLLDRFSDVAILLGITLSSYVPDFYGYMLIIVTLLVSYLGTQSQVVLKKRNYGGLIGRADRLLLIAIFSFASLVYSDMLCYGVIVILILSSITLIQRLFKIFKGLKRHV